MGIKRKQHSAEFKARVAMAALSGEKTLAELSAEFGVHPTMISEWKPKLVKRAGELFARGNRAPAVGDANDEFAIRDRLAKADPGNASWKRDLAASYQRIGDVLMAQGKRAATESAELSVREAVAGCSRDCAFAGISADQRQGIGSKPAWQIIGCGQTQRGPASRVVPSSGRPGEPHSIQHGAVAVKSLGRQGFAS